MGSKLVVGIDPDSEKHGVSRYIDGKLVLLEKLSTVEIVKNILDSVFVQDEQLIFSIENVCANNFVYSRNVKATKGAMAAVGLSIGRCQQAQVELMRWLDRYRIPYILHKPQSGNWADKRDLFERITGWDKQSNEDTRSAAYFGWLEASKNVSP